MPAGSGLVTFNATCLPSAGALVTWCAFGVSATKLPSMVPADVAAVVAAPRAGGALDIWVEDRLTQAFALPPCFATQLSALAAGSASRDAASGALRATWSRPATPPPPAAAAGYVALAGPMWMIGASATDADNATLAHCDNASLPIHTYAQTAIAVTF